MWPDHRIQKLLGIELPIIQAPMAGAQRAELAIAVANAGGLGSLPCAMLSPEQLREQVAQFRSAAPGRSLNLNFFCHRTPLPDPAREAQWKQRLAAYYREFGVDPDAPVTSASRAPFDNRFCDLVEQLRPEVLSFHFGLPDAPLLDRVRACGAKILSSATTVAEARWLAARGCDAVIAQGAEAGGHRGMFLTDDIATQIGTFALLPQIVDAVRVPVIASGGIGDARGIVAAFALGASAVQLGTAYLLCPEARLAPLYRAALLRAIAADVEAEAELKVDLNVDFKAESKVDTNADTNADTNSESRTASFNATIESSQPASSHRSVVAAVAAPGAAPGVAPVDAPLDGTIDPLRAASFINVSPEQSIEVSDQMSSNPSAADATALTNLFSGRPARGLINRLMREQGPMNPAVPAFPQAAAALAGLRAKAEAAGDDGFMSLWAGQAVAMARSVSAAELTRQLATDALAHLGRFVR